jgi:hypothetical protein
VRPSLDRRMKANLRLDLTGKCVEVLISSDGFWKIIKDRERMS